MSWSSRRAVATLVTATLFGTLSLQLALAQQDVVPIKGGRLPPIGQQPPTGKPRPADASEFYGFDLPTEEALKGKLKDIAVYIEVQNWPEAIERLQGLLDRTDDSFAPVERGGPDGKSRIMVSVRIEAARMVSNLPKAGLDFYRLTNNPPAAELLKLAKAGTDPKMLAEVMRRYLYTDSGPEATELLGTYLLDRGEYSAAALCFERLFQRVNPRQLGEVTLFKSALAFQAVKTQNQSNLELAWGTLEAKTDKLTLGSKQYAVADLKDFVSKRKSLGLSPEKADWVMDFGGPSRSAQGFGGTAFLNPRWKFDTMAEGTTKSWVAQSTKYLDENKQPHLHAFSPIAVTLTRDGDKIPLMVYRSFWGIHSRAVKAIPKDEVKAGEVYWEAPGSWSLERMLKEPKYVGTLNQWLQAYVTSRVRPQVLFENSVIGSLSTDNQRVYAVDDFQVPPYNAQQVGRFPGQPGVGGVGGPLGQAIQHNRLQAYDLDSGKLLWEIGSADDKEKKDLSDSYFLGPPLPLNGKLFVLNEKDQELRLLTLEASNGQIVGKPQRLADMREKINVEINRRFNAAHLAYGEGILICPTNSGGILGVDLLTNSLVWAYGYRDKPKVAEQPIPGQPGFPGVGGPPGMIMLPDGRWVPQTQAPSNWRVTPPVITEGKVVFTAPDSSAVHCLNLRDGGKIWKNQRKEGDLYMAGVFAGKVLIVGKNYARAVSLSDGTELWSLETGLPSGMGIASKDVYYLPLAQGSKSREPEIALVDMNKGYIMARTKSRNKEIPGNLLFYEGEVLSQSLTQVSAYPQLDVELKNIDAILAKNDKDPEGLTRRGDLRLDKGDLGGAIDDLRLALGHMKEEHTAELRGKAKEKLFESMTEYLQRDFDSAEKYLKEYETLCKVVDPKLAGEELKKAQAEEKKRLGNLYCLLGRGKEGQKKLVEAFEAYMNFGTLGSADNEMMSVVDDQGVKASPMVWAQGRITAMVAKASKEDRAPLEKLVSERFAKIQASADLPTLRNFVSTFGSISQIGRDARLQLAERLIVDNSDSSLVDAERHLNILRLQQEDPSMSARAVEAMARLMTRKGLMEDAAFFYRVLGRDFGKVVVKEGKTGQEFFNDLATDKRFLPYLDEPTSAFSGRLKTEEINSNNSYQVNLFQLEQEGEKLPFFQQNFRLAIRSDYSQLKVMNRETNEELWSHSLNEGRFQQYIQHQFNRNLSIQPRFAYQNLGHLVLLQVGHKVYALDPVTKKQLWEKSLCNTTTVNQGFRNITVDPRDGSTQVVYIDGWMQRLGRTGPVSPTAVCLLTTDGLQGVDPISGQILWTRNDVSKNSHLFNDEHHVYTIEMAADGTVGTTRVFRLHDGVTVQTKDFSDLYRNRVSMRGRQILTHDTDARNQVVLRLYDILTGQDLYRGTFAAGSFVLQPETEDLAGVVEPTGKVTIVDLKTLKTLPLKEGMKAEHLQKVTSLHLLRDSKDFYITVMGQGGDQQLLNGPLMSNLMPGMGMRALSVNGEIYSFGIESGELNWFNRVENQMIVLDEFERIPVMLLTARYNKWTDKNRIQVMNYTALRSYDKRTGKLIWDKEEQNTGRYQQFHTVRVDARAGRVDLLSPNLTWSHSLESGPVGGKPVGDGKQGNGPKPDGGSSTTPVVPPPGFGRKPVPPFAQPIPPQIALPPQIILPERNAPK